MKLMIVRHAVAFERDPKRWPDDRTRPLTPEGALRARRAAQGLKRVADRPARLLTSHLTRSVQTAAILTAVARWPRALECAALTPEGSPEAVLKALQGQPDDLIAIVGHQPALGRLIARCLPGEARPQAFELKKFGVALLSFDGVPCAGGATLGWLLTPGLLRALRP